MCVWACVCEHVCVGVLVGITVCYWGAGTTLLCLGGS